MYVRHRARFQTSPRVVVVSGGFTIIEMVVAITILGLLIALLLPAVQNAREAARRTQCSVRLRDLCLASQNFASTLGRFPGAYPPKGQVEANQIRQLWSVHVSLLPYLDHQALQNQLDLQDNSWSLYLSPPTSTRNSAGLKQTVIAFQCPSDKAAPGAVNYRVSGGTSPGFFASVGINPPDAALFGVVSREGLNPRKVRDGLSNTAFFSERLIGPSAPWGEIVLLGLGTFLTATDAASACRSAPAFLNVDNETGSSWLPGGYHTTWYNHILTPNSNVKDCVNAAQLAYLGVGTISARSAHSGGVNVGLCDGATKFVNQNISENVWRAVGSVDGREAISNSDW